jgi:site-specific DNA recombinase
VKRAALYARYSSDLQSAKSCEDQLALLREEAAKRGWTVAAEYRDEAISGSSIVRRPGILAMLADAETGAFDVVMAEALDRLSRDEVDSPMLRRRLAFHEVTIWTLSEGDVQPLHAAIMGVVNSMHLAEMARKIRRGLRGVIADGRSAGGRVYGYAPVKGERGRLVIDPEAAAVVRRIFDMYCDAVSPLTIAKTLNAEGVPGPVGGAWNRSALYGDNRQQRGILLNRLYIGERVWNRERTKIDPATGKHKRVLNPPAEWRVAMVPELRIIDDDTWTHAQKRIAALAGGRGGARRPKSLFGGLLVCATCGGRFHSFGGGLYGCANNKQRGLCPNRVMIREAELLDRATSGLREGLLDPRAVRSAEQAFHAEMARLKRDSGSRPVELEREIAETGKRITRLVAAIEAGASTPETIDRLRVLNADRERLTGELGAHRQRHSLALAADVSGLYRAAVDRLGDMLADTAERALPLKHTLRGFVSEIILTPREAPYRKGYHLEIRGDLAAFLTPTPNLNMSSGGIRGNQAVRC